MRDVLFWSIVAGVIWCTGFLFGCWLGATSQYRAVRRAPPPFKIPEALPEKPGSELEPEPGFLEPPKESDQDQWAALRVRFPHLTPAQLAAILERRCQERRQ